MLCARHVVRAEGDMFQRIVICETAANSEFPHGRSLLGQREMLIASTGIAPAAASSFRFLLRLGRIRILLWFLSLSLTFALCLRFLLRFCTLSRFSIVAVSVVSVVPVIGPVPFVRAGLHGASLRPEDGRRRLRCINRLWHGSWSGFRCGRLVSRKFHIRERIQPASNRGTR